MGNQQQICKIWVPLDLHCLKVTETPELYNPKSEFLEHGTETIPYPSDWKASRGSFSCRLLSLGCLVK